MQQSVLRSVLVAEILMRLEESPVVMLLGARQVGKTTLAREIARRLGGATVFDLESPSGRAALERTPELTLRDCAGLVVIDEVQRLPRLFEILRPVCDDPNRRATFLLLGSASPDLVRGVSETLAGRAQFVPVAGFSMEEVGSGEQDRLWLRGGFPRSFLARTNEAAGRWLESFRRTLVERDVPALGLSVSLVALDRFWHLLAHWHGQVWNAAELGRAMDVSSPTANRYRDILAGTYMVRVLQPWFENLEKRQVKSPKVYLRDSGLLHQFLGIEDMLALRSHPKYRSSWEGFALEQTLAALGDSGAYFWSTQRGAELDLLITRAGHRWGFEFKCTDAPAPTRSMHIALADLRLDRLWVVYPGEQSYPLDERITALPLRQITAAAREAHSPAGD